VSTFRFAIFDGYLKVNFTVMLTTAVPINIEMKQPTARCVTVALWEM
jgi:hypothetical protein